MIEVFKTNVEQPDEARKIVQSILVKLPGVRVNFDLDDCDRILRVEGPAVCIDSIIEVVNLNGYEVQLLE